MQHCTSCKGITHKTFSLFHQLADCIQSSSELINARTIDSTLDFKFILKRSRIASAVSASPSLPEIRNNQYHQSYKSDTPFHLTNHAERTGIGIPENPPAYFNNVATLSLFFISYFMGRFTLPSMLTNASYGGTMITSPSCRRISSLIYLS